MYRCFETDFGVKSKQQSLESQTSPTSGISMSTATPPPPPQFANDTSPGASPTNGESGPVGDVISSQTISSKTRTVETITVSLIRCDKFS